MELPFDLPQISAWALAKMFNFAVPLLAMPVGLVVFAQVDYKQMRLQDTEKSRVSFGI